MRARLILVAAVAIALCGCGRRLNAVYEPVPGTKANFSFVFHSEGNGWVLIGNYAFGCTYNVSGDEMRIHIPNGPNGNYLRPVPLDMRVFLLNGGSRLVGGPMRDSYWQVMQGSTVEQAEQVIARNMIVHR